MVGTPSCKFFVYKLAVLIKKRVCKNGEGKHILLSNLRYYFHKYLLMFNKLIHIVNSKRAIGEFKSAKQSLVVFSIKN